MKGLNTYINEWKISDQSTKNIDQNSCFFIYKITEECHIKIFDEDWPQYKDYFNKVYMNKTNVSLNTAGYTLNMYKPGTYKFEIKDINNVNNCRYMFYDCFNLLEVPLFNTSKVKNMEDMFYECKILKSVPKFNTRNVTDMHWMFHWCDKLEDVPLFDTRNVEAMWAMFEGCYNLSEKTKRDWSKIYDFETDSQK